MSLNITLHTFEALNPKLVVEGENQWDKVKPSDFGPEEDYRIERYDDEFSVVHPVSKAGREWCYSKLPEGLDRVELGFKVETRYLAMITAGLKRDKLMSREEFEEAMEEAHNLALQWDNR